MTPIRTIWFSGKDTIGIVAGKNEEFNYWKAYIGVGIGVDTDVDIRLILDWGSKLTEEDARHFFPEIKLTYGD